MDSKATHFLKRTVFWLAVVSLVGWFWWLFIVPVFASTYAQLWQSGAASASNFVTFGVSGTGNVRAGIVWTPAANLVICDVEMNAAKNGSPTDYLRLTIYDDPSSTTPDSPGSGTSVDVLGSGLGTSLGTIAFTLPDCRVFFSGHTYGFVLTRTGSLDATNNYDIEKCTGSCSSVSSLNNHTYSSGSWTDINENASWRMTANGGTALDFPELTYDDPNACPQDPSFFSTCFWYSMFIQAFVPAEDSYSAITWADTLNDMEGKAPFAYFLDVRDQVLAMDDTTGGSWTETVTLMDGSDFEMDIPFDIMPASGSWRTAWHDYAFPAMTFVFWATAIAYVVHRFRDINSNPL